MDQPNKVTGADRTDESSNSPLGQVVPVGDIMQMLVDGDAHGTEMACREHLHAHGSLQRVHDLLRQCMYDIGDGWAGRRLGVADEHVAHATARIVAARIDSVVANAGPAARCVVACPDNEGHDFGSLMLSSLLRAEGWDVRRTGERTPAEAIVELVLSSDARVLVLSATLVARLPEIAHTAALTRKAVTASQSEPVAIAFGGQAARWVISPDHLGVDKVTSSADELIQWMQPRLVEARAVDG